MPNMYRGLYRGGGEGGAEVAFGGRLGQGVDVTAAEMKEEQGGQGGSEEEEGGTWREVNCDPPPTTPSSLHPPTPTAAKAPTQSATTQSVAALYAAHVTRTINSLPPNRKPSAFIAEPLSGNAGGIELPDGYLRWDFVTHKISLSSTPL